MKSIYLTLCLLFSMVYFVYGQSYSEDKKAILTVMKAQEKAWSAHDLEGFMEGYWKSDSLTFYGASGLTKGWQATLNNYKRGYPSPADSGTLRFTINDVSPIDATSYWVMGAYHLERTKGNAEGVFMIIFKKIDGEWKIVADMSCG
ncbi:YybH family protein [Altibacter sp. HG106]|uniref:YybH family protein n=1 Tax=Altibacter sp. HG106 TaxID=3023937 RepID=UPI00234FC833|nr:nuclear transport factor 2 family protein [Altibacter sp. HG106]MDC7994079.1 nuclear transport factor 2 family protein [Altibacter sp. HG106]